MSIVFLLLGVLVVLAAALVATGRGGGLPPAPPAPDRPEPVLPDGPLTPADVHDVRFAVAARGYRMEQVDAVLDRLGAELAARDARLAALAGRVEHLERPAPASGAGE